MIQEYCRRGVVAGAIAGIAYGIFMAVVGNPLAAYMENLAVQGHDHAGQHIWDTTALVSVGSGVLWGIFLGGAFAVAYYFLEPTLPGTDTVKPYVLAGAGFLTVSVTPWLVLAPTAPGAEKALGMEPRLLIYGGSMVAGAALAALSIAVYRTLSTRRRDIAAVAGLAPVAVAVLVLGQVTPTIISSGEIPETLFAAYQGLVALSQAALWLLLAASYNWLSRRGAAESGTTTGDPTGVTEL